MTSLRDEARRLSLKARQEIDAHAVYPCEDTSIIESALLTFAKLVLERKSTETMKLRGSQLIATPKFTRLTEVADDAYRAMTKELLKELA